MKVSRVCVAKGGGSAATATISFLVIVLPTGSAFMLFPCPTSIFFQDVFVFPLFVPLAQEGWGSNCLCLALQIDVCWYEVPGHQLLRQAVRGGGVGVGAGVEKLM